MRHKKRLFAIGVLIIAGLGWLYWKHSRPPAAAFAFDFEARIENEIVAFHSAIGCYPFEAGIGNFFQTATHYAVRERAFAAKLKSGRTFFVSVPDICAYVRRADGEYLTSWPNWDRPTIAAPRDIVPLTYLMDGEDGPEMVRVFTSLDGKSNVSEFEILRSTVRQINQTTDANLPERAGDRSDPFAPPSSGWAGVVFLPITDAPKLEPTWVDAQWDAGACDIIRLNEQGRNAISTLDSYARSIAPLWPRLWRGIALSDLFVIPRVEEYDATAVRKGLNTAIPTHLAGDRLEIQPEHAGTIEVFRNDPSHQGLRFRASSYFFNGVQLSTDGDKKRLPFVIQCAAQAGLYVPTVLHFSRPSL